MAVLVEDSSQSLPLADVEVGEGRLVGDGWWQGAEWSCVVDALAGPVGVVELLVLA